MQVLIVEDHDDSRFVLTNLLEHWGCTVASAPTLQSGLNSLEHERFDAIVSDIALPDGTGYALVTEAKRRNKNVLAIALTGYISPGDRKIGKLSGFDHHLSKPFDCQLLRSVLLAPSGLKRASPQA